MTDSIGKFEDIRYNLGWKLIITKNNNTFITTTLYDQSGKLKEIKNFNFKIDDELAMFDWYLGLFTDNPNKNIKKMSALIVRV